MASISLATSVKNLNRLQQIARVLGRHGFGHFLAKLDLAKYLPLGRALAPDKVGQTGGGAGNRWVED